MGGGERRGVLKRYRNGDVQIIYETILVTIAIRHSDRWVRLANAAAEI